MTITQTDIGKRLQAIYLDWKKGKPYRGSGMVHFAKELNKSRPAVEKYISGAFHTVPSDVLDRLSEMGYNTEWVLHESGKMKAAQSGKIGFTDIIGIRNEVANSRRENKLNTDRLTARQTGIEKELDNVKKELADAKEDIKALHSILKKIANTDNLPVKIK